MLPETVGTDNPPRLLSDDEFRSWKRDQSGPRLSHFGTDSFPDTADYLDDSGPPAYQPTPLDDAERLGFDLTMEGFSANPPRGMADEWLVAFFGGVVRAWSRQFADRFADFDEVDAYLGSVEDRWTHAESAEANGVIEAREGGRP